jgi:hypothetical protein
MPNNIERLCDRLTSSESEYDFLTAAVSDDEVEKAASGNFSLGNCTDARVCPIAE